MLEESALPQWLTSLLQKSAAGFDLEALQQPKHIAGSIQALEQEVAVIWHDAVGRHSEISGRSFGSHEFEEPSALRGISKSFWTLVTTKSDEVNPGTTVVFRGEARGFSAVGVTLSYW